LCLQNLETFSARH